MPRKPRFNLVGIPQHVIQRGNNREPCFFSEQDYRRYLEDLIKASQKYSCCVHAYVLMTNHVHILATPRREGGLSNMLQKVTRCYAQRINYRFRRTGHLWSGRFKASLVEQERYFFTCMRYIELNPVRANRVAHPGEYRWSSNAHNAAGLGDPLLQHHPLYTALADDAQQRQYAYRELFRLHIDNGEIHAIREALNQELVLGREDFKDKIQRMTKRQSRPGQPGRPRVEEAEARYFVIND